MSVCAHNARLIQLMLGLKIRFLLYKENKDTQDALTVIGRMLHVQVFTCQFYLFSFPNC